MEQDQEVSEKEAKWMEAGKLMESEGILIYEISELVRRNHETGSPADLALGQIVQNGEEVATILFELMQDAVSTKQAPPKEDVPELWTTVTAKATKRRQHYQELRQELEEGSEAWHKLGEAKTLLISRDELIATLDERFEAPIMT